MYDCFDSNGIRLYVGATVMCVANGSENEGQVIKLKANNKVDIIGETGIVTVQGEDCFLLP